VCKLVLLVLVYVCVVGVNQVLEVGHALHAVLVAPLHFARHLGLALSHLLGLISLYDRVFELLLPLIQLAEGAILVLGIRICDIVLAWRADPA